jgi:hypothetical protein
VIATDLANTARAARSNNRAPAGSTEPKLCEDAGVRTAMFVLASSASFGCVTALHVTTAATVSDGAAASAFSLPAQDGTQVSLATALADGPVVLVFYRGYW